MIVIALMLQAPVLGAIGPQRLPATGCAAFLWRAEPQPLLVAMAGGESARLRLAVNGKLVDLPRTATRGEAVMGIASSADYAGDGMSATLDLSVAGPGDMVDGARVPSGALTFRAGDADAVVVPVAGLLGCAKGAR